MVRRISSICLCPAAVGKGDVNTIWTIIKIIILGSLNILSCHEREEEMHLSTKLHNWTIVEMMKKKHDFVVLVLNSSRLKNLIWNYSFI